MTIKQRCLNFLHSEDTLPESKSKTAKLLQTKFGVSERHSRRIVRQFFQKKLKGFQFASNATNQFGYKIIEGSYHVPVEDGEIHEVPVSFVTELNYYYRSDGLNMSIPDICFKLNLLEEEFTFYKNTFKITRTGSSHVPTQEVSTEDLVYVEEKKRVNNYKRLLRKRLDDSAKQDAFQIQVVDALSEHRSINTRTIQVRKLVKDSYKVKHLVAIIADIHAGAYVEGLKAVQNYNKSIQDHYMSLFAHEINQFEAEKVTLLLLGDTIESVTGLNHKNSWHNMEQGVYLSKAIINGYDLLAGFIDSVNNVVKINAVSGNHGRLSANYAHDPYGSAELTIYEFLKRDLDGFIDVEYHHNVVVDNIEGVNYLITHGGTGMSKKPENMIINYIPNNDYSVLIQGHKHTREILRDERRYRYMTAPSLFTGNNWSETQGFSSTAGMMVIYRDDLDMLKTQDITLLT